MAESLTKDVVMEVVSDWVDTTRPLVSDCTFGELDLDSLDRVDIIHAIEKELQIEIPCSIFDGDIDPDDITLDEFVRRIETL